ncbi:uncharacterized protein LOC134656767 isoform X1 [Cydia amplana]|uniref:uncharacterized protein LOC134656767 isoform X1 n=1 Tax=Cydia amplana TaxID=1869771 RepID=UPI002FE5EA01
MSLKAYEDACIRAELFGQPKPDKDEFLEKHKHLDIVEFEEVDIKTTITENTAMLDENIQQTGGGLNELNSILNSTQTKINRLKGVCGSLTNFFRVKLSAKDNLSYSSEQSYVGQTNYDKDSVPARTELGSINQDLGPGDNEMTARAGNSQDGGNLNNALDDLKTMQKNDTTAAAFKEAGEKMTGQTNKLESLLEKAERAQSSMSHQNKQMRSFLR